MLEGSPSTWKIEDYEKLCRHYVPLVVGLRQYNTVKRSVPLSKIATPSDEALAFILLDNSYERWIDSYCDPDSEKKEEWTGYKYSSEGRGKNAKKYCGWSIAGMARFKKFNEEVAKQIRKMPVYKALENKLQQEASETYNNKKRLNKKMDDMEEPLYGTAAGDDLDDTDDEQDEEGYQEVSSLSDSATQGSDEASSRVATANAVLQMEKVSQQADV